MDAKLAKTYYSPGGYWKGFAAIKKLSEAAKVPEETAKKWLFKQALWQIFLPAPKRIPRPKFDVPIPNKVHQADLLFLPHYIRRGRVDIHRDQAIVERFNRTLAERLFGHQYAVEMRLTEGQRSTAWVKRLPEVVAALNNEVTSLIGKKPAVAIKEKNVYAKPSTPYLRPVGEREKKLPSIVNVRYLYQPGELEGGVKRATDPIWSLKVYNIERSFTKPNQPVLYYLHDGPKRGFVREELLVVPPNTQLPPEQL